MQETALDIEAKKVAADRAELDALRTALAAEKQKLADDSKKLSEECVFSAHESICTPSFLTLACV